MPEVGHACSFLAIRPESKPTGQELSFIERARRAQIIEAATVVIAEDGFGQASLARIAQRAGVSKGVISYHFSGKNELIMQVVVAVYADGAEAMTPAIEAATTPPERLAAYLRSNLDFIARNPIKIRALIGIFLSFRGDDGTLPFDARSEEPIIADLEAGFREGQADGSFRAFDTAVMARSVRGAIDAVSPQVAVYPDLDLAAYAEELVILFDLATRREP